MYCRVKIVLDEGQNMFIVRHVMVEQYETHGNVS